MIHITAGAMASADRFDQWWRREGMRAHRFRVRRRFFAIVPMLPSPGSICLVCLAIDNTGRQRWKRQLVVQEFRDYQLVLATSRSYAVAGKKRLFLFQRFAPHLVNRDISPRALAALPRISRGDPVLPLLWLQIPARSFQKAFGHFCGRCFSGSRI